MSCAVLLYILAYKMRNFGQNFINLTFFIPCCLSCWIHWQEDSLQAYLGKKDWLLYYAGCDVRIQTHFIHVFWDNSKFRIYNYWQFFEHFFFQFDLNEGIYSSYVTKMTGRQVHGCTRYPPDTFIEKRVILW